MADATIAQRCSCAQCSNVHYSHGLCRMHYAKLRDSGELRIRPYMAGKSLAERIKLMSAENLATGCWIWQRAVNNKGYGQLRYGEKLLLAHRASYEAAHGSIPEELFICHRCDTPACVNPDHLFAGLEQANSDDKLEKERQARGTSHGMARLTEDQIRAIRIDPRRNKPVGDAYGITAGCVSMIKHRKRWAHVI